MNKSDINYQFLKLKISKEFIKINTIAPMGDKTNLFI